MNEERLASLLRESAEEIHPGTELPRRVRRRVRARQSLAVGLASVAFLAIGSFALSAVSDGTSPIPPAIEEPDQQAEGEQIARGSLDGVAWTLEVRAAPGAYSAQEQICLVTGKSSRCFYVDVSFAGHIGMAIGHVEELDRFLLVAKTPGYVEDVTLREYDGATYAAQSATASDPEAAYFYSFFEGPVEGVATVGTDPVRYITFSGSRNESGTRTATSVSATGFPFPELGRRQGDFAIAGTGTQGGGYTAILQRTTEDLCLYLGEEQQFRRCRGLDEGVSETLPLWMTRVLECPECKRSGPRFVAVVAGEVGDEVARMVIRHAEVNSMVEVGSVPLGDEEVRFFHATVEVSGDGGEMTFIAMDAQDRELDRASIGFATDRRGP